MLTVPVRTQDGGTAGEVSLDEALFGIEPNLAVLHQVVTAQLAAARRGTHKTKTRAEVRGGGAKPHKQKGTGRARQGSIRAPQFVGGGKAHGPVPRSHRQKVNKKLVRLALRSALSDRARSERVVVIDGWTFDSPATKRAVAALDALALAGQGRILLVIDRATDRNAALSFRNLPGVDLVEDRELNAYDIIRSDWLVFTRSTLPGTGRDGDGDGDDGERAATELNVDLAEQAEEASPEPDVTATTEVAAEEASPEPDVAAAEAADAETDVAEAEPDEPAATELNVDLAEQAEDAGGEPADEPPAEPGDET